MNGTRPPKFLITNRTIHCSFGHVINEYNQIKTAKFQISVLDELEVILNQSPYQLSTVADLKVKDREVSGVYVGTHCQGCRW